MPPDVVLGEVRDLGLTSCTVRIGLENRNPSPVLVVLGPLWNGMRVLGPRCRRLVI